MRELSVNVVQEVNGAVLLFRATYIAYRTNPAFRRSVNTAAKWVGSTALGVYATVTFTGGE